MRLMLDSEEAKEVTKLYTALLASLREFETTQYSAWGKGVDDISQSKLKQPLLTRDPETVPCLSTDPPAAPIPARTHPPQHGEPPAPTMSLPNFGRSCSQSTSTRSL